MDWYLAFPLNDVMTPVCSMNGPIRELNLGQGSLSQKLFGYLTELKLVEAEA